MNTFQHIKMALSALRSNWLRSTLTMMIIAIGMMALVGILTATDALIYSINDGFSSLGASSFEIKRKSDQLNNRREGRVEKRADPISLDEAREFKERYTYPSEVSISFQASSSTIVSSGKKNSDPIITLYGVDENSMQARGESIAYGRYFSQLDIKSHRPSIVISKQMAQDYFQSAFSSIGKSITIDGMKMTVIGILEDKGSSMNYQSSNVVQIPLTIAAQKYGYSNSNYELTVMVKSANLLASAMADAIGLMRSVRKLRIDQENDFEFITSSSIIERIKEDTAIVRSGTLAIGIITIIGAAIGLMNIMFVSVTERKKEIGITKSLGATRQTILALFLSEAVIICQIGGVMGIILGIMAGNIVTIFTGSEFYIPWIWMILAFVLCSIVGILAGMIPAIQASKLDPIESLRYE